MTVGQRIMQNRKRLGLSQEALGEKLGVSRQAIYKWESDSTLPEVEKLVALSKIFSVTVGELLGVEEPAADGEASSGELTESQIQVVEEIVSRYRDAAPEKPAKKRRWPLVAALVLFLFMAGWLLHLNGKLDSLQGSYNSLQNSIEMMDRQVDAQVQSITMRVEDVLERMNRFTIEQDAAIESVDFEAQTVTFSLYAMPKTFHEGMTARFTAAAGGEVTETAGVLGEKNDFTGTLTLPLTNERIELSVTFSNDGQQDTQPVRTFSSLYDCSFEGARLDNYPLFFNEHNGVLSRDSYTVYTGPLSREPFMPQAEIDRDQTRLGLFADGELLFWMKKSEEEAQNRHDREWKYAQDFYSTDDVTLDPGKTYCLAAVLTDVYGREEVLPDRPIVFLPSENRWTLAEEEARPEDFHY